MNKFAMAGGPLGYKRERGDRPNERMFNPPPSGFAAELVSHDYLVGFRSLYGHVRNWATVNKRWKEICGPDAVWPWP